MMQSSAVRKAERAPGPARWPLIGNPGAFLGAIPFFEKNWRTYGDVYNVHVGRSDFLVLVHPEHIQHVLVTNRNNYIKARSYDGLRALTGDSVLTLNGDAWKERRAMAQPAFHRQALEQLTAIMVETGARYFDALAKRASGVIDMHPEMVNITLDVVINTLFGQDVLHSSQISHRMLGDALALISETANGLQLPAWIPTPRNVKFKRTMARLDQTVHQIIRVARERAQEGTLLAMLLAARDDRGQPLSDQALRDEVVTMVIAGHETTALTLTWFFALLEKRPDVLARMREEVEPVLRGAEPSFADLPKLVYVRQVIDEVMRLRPPVPMIAREAEQADVLGGFHVAEGQTIIPFLWGVHRHPDHWPNPLHFDPERFTPAANKARHTGAYAPFALGPRSCIGNQFALFEATILLAQLVTRFELEIADCSDVKPLAIGSTRPSKPVRARLRPR